MFTVSPGWEFEVDRGPDWLLVKVRQPQSRQAAAQSLDGALWDLLERHSAHRLVVEFDQIDRFDESLIDQLLELHARIEGHGGMLRVCGLSPFNRRLLVQRHLDDRLVPYCDRGDAMLGHPLPRQPR
jgi:hypothetical protein